MGKRDFYFDNAKFILILLVVFGHIISPLKNNHHILFALYIFIFLFHMPAFILISGYFCKGFNKPGYIKKTIKRTLIPYFIFQVIYSFYYYFTGYDDHLKLTLLDPHWSLWFLISIFFWHLAIIPFSKLGKYGFPVAILLGAAIGYFDVFGSYLSIERTFVFFPFFYLGYLLKNEHFVKLRKSVNKFAAVPILAGIFMICYFVFPDAWTEWLLGDSSYADMGIKTWTDGIFRLVFYAGSFLTTFCVMALMPKTKKSFTKLGQNTLYVYLLHGFFIKTINLSPYYNSIGHKSQYVALFILSIVIVLLLASKPVREFAKPLVELKLPQIKRNNTFTRSQ
ncbi:fucose 4-O-acetylase-like acetyltransferase [Scopulibacillus daqui]|uniref:Fucose 4-O-acetylase-like acetyltransferase n=1 Tax=Scopulibacillus daqui TaxID=1469162 RepID=A0ABS2Q2M4_9BACL|nr:acyltransferase family protein [Scopulibacillus daqui]MBM7646546.1 fucose 4-O-acetylase-like acetyltransferase [Scopulibacillus daqui]